MMDHRSAVREGEVWMPGDADETAVARYLEGLRSGMGASADPIDRLLHRAAAGAFVAHARKWAERNAVSPRAFVLEGVPLEVVEAAWGAPMAELRRQQLVERVLGSMPARQPFTVDGLATRTGVHVRVAAEAVEQAVALGRAEAVAISDVQGRRTGDVLYRRIEPPARNSTTQCPNWTR
jgi:hypothetical protein